MWDAASNSLYYGVTLIGEAAFTPPPPTAHTLTLGHTGQGINPVADPTNSEGYEAGQYLENEAIDLSGAIPDEGYQIDSWTGTSDDNSTGDTNSLVMPDEAHEVKVNYVEIPPEPSGMFKMTIPGNGYFTGFAHVDLSNDTGIDWGDESELQVLTAPYDNGVEHEYAEGEWYANITNPGRVLRLDVEDSAVAYEPGALVQLVNLTDLTLHDSNDITILAGEIAQLGNLVRLHLDGVAGTISDGEIGMLATNIEELYIANMPGCNIGTGELEFLTKIKSFTYGNNLSAEALDAYLATVYANRDNYDGNGVDPIILDLSQGGNAEANGTYRGRGRTIYGSGIQVQVRE